MIENNEIWKDIPGYEGKYQVSNLGRVKSINRVIMRKDGISRTISERIRKQRIDNRGYYRVTLHHMPKQVHQLVAMAFLNHKPNGHKLVVDHINNNGIDNRAENLQIVTQRYNSSKDKKGGSSRYVGVHIDKSKNKWRAQIVINSKVVHIGYYTNDYDAHIAYQNRLNKITN